MFFILPAGADSINLEENNSFDVKTIGGTLSWKQNVYLFNIGVLILIVSSVAAYYLFGMSYLLPILMSVCGVPVIIYALRLINEDVITASYKIRPVGYLILMITPLIITIGAII
jgi:hypothetical protein